MKRVENAIVLTDEEYAKLKRAADRAELAKPRMNTTEIVLLCMAVFALVFIVAMTAIFCIYQSVPDTLIQCVLGAGGVEAVALAGIKISKVLKSKEVIDDGGYNE